ncbi:unnamed protein product, partial [Urochloa humidicola]
PVAMAIALVRRFAPQNQPRSIKSTLPRPLSHRHRIRPAASPRKHGTAGAAERAHKRDQEKEAPAGRREDSGVDPPHRKLPPFVNLGLPAELRLSP